MTQPAVARPYASYTDAQLRQLIQDARGPARRQVQQELDYRQSNPSASVQAPPNAGLPSPTSSADQVRQQFLAEQTWAALSTNQQQIVDAHADAQVALADATRAMSTATSAAMNAQRQFQAATELVTTVAEKAQAVITALPDGQQAAVADVAAQVPGLVEQMTSLTANVTQVASEAEAAQTSLASAGQVVSNAVTQAVAEAVASVASSTPSAPVSTPRKQKQQ